MGSDLLRVNESHIRDAIGEPDFSRGKLYYRSGKVHEFQLDIRTDELRFSCTVEGTRNYQVIGWWKNRGLSGICDCARYKERGACKHLVAGLLQFLAKMGAPENQAVEDSSFAQRLIQQYIRSVYEEAKVSAAVEKARLVPNLSANYKDYPSVSFQIGVERLYRLRDIGELMQRIASGDVHRYGKPEKSVIDHSIENFDERSQAIIRILQNAFSQYRSMSSRYSYSTWMSSFGAQIVLTGENFAQLMKLYEGQSIECSRGGSWEVRTADPELELLVEPGERGAELALVAAEPFQVFGDQQHLYAMSDNFIFCCSSGFRANMRQLAKTLPLHFTVRESDVAAFCSSVLAKIQPYVTVSDPKQYLSGFQPDTCTIQYYFDLNEQHGLQVRPVAHYEQEDFPCNGEAANAGNTRRDRETEIRALLPLEQDFHRIMAGTYAQNEGADLYEFLTDGVHRFQAVGEVYLSERLRAKRITGKTAQAGVSVSGGMLLLQVDTGEFPPEELEELYQSLLRKRKYHKLKDGRYLTLDGSPYEAIAEAAHMLQLSPAELKTGQVTMPAFRGLYLDGVLGQAKGVQVERDRSFRELLRNFKSVEDSDYAVPESLEQILRPYQKTGFRWLKTLESYGFGGILADEMGLGKTLQVIAFLLSSRERLKQQPALIVCPTSLLFNWLDECSRFAPELQVSLIMGDAKTRAGLLAKAEGQVLVTSYDLLKRDIQQYDDRRFSCCILDEGQFIKNRSTLASKAVKRINCAHRIVLTGTPIENRLSELWNLFDFLMPGYLFSHGVFVEKLEKPIIKAGNAQAGEQLSRMIRPFLLRRLKKDVLTELPEKIEHIHRIVLSDEERKVYSAELHHAQASIREDTGKLEILALLTRLRQLCCAPGLCYENYGSTSGKLDACADLCASMVENGHQLLVFSQFTSALALIAARLDELSITHFTLQGSTPGRERARLVKEFQAGSASVFLISLKAGGTGLNLTAADVVVHFDPWWNVAAQNQATDRAHRIGQDSHVHVYQLIAKDTIEERILDLQSKKAELMDAVVGGNDTGILSVSREELLSLLESE